MSGGRCAIDFQWTENAMERLRRQWADGIPTAEIGRDLGCGKNAVVGKARRMGLPVRPSPVKTLDYDALAPEMERLKNNGLSVRAIAERLGLDKSTVWSYIKRWSERAAVGLPKLQYFSKPNLVDGADNGGFAPNAPVLAPSAESGPLQAEASEDPPPFLTPGGAGIAGGSPRPPVSEARDSVAPGKTCMWVEGERPRWRYCDDPAEPGRSYCAAHCAVAYPRLATRRAA
jgi:GcrA cell cycle regulator